MKSFSSFVLRICFVVLVSGAIFPVFSQQRANTGEEVKIQNYPDAPLQLRILSTFTRTTDSEKSIRTCFSYSIENKRRKKIDTFSYEIIDRNGNAFVQGQSSFFPKSSRFLTVEQCVSNSLFEDEVSFTFRLTFVERKGRTLWESDDHKKKIEEFFRK